MMHIVIVPTARAHRYTQMFVIHRHSGRDCRNPEHRDVNYLILQSNPHGDTYCVYLYRHPWRLDPGNPCRDDVL